MKNKSTIVYLVLFLIVIVISVLSVIYSSTMLITIISTISTLLGIVGVLFSFNLDRNISEASFLLELHQSFRGDPKISEISEKLEKLFLGNKNVEITEDDRSNLVEYLTFFEMLASMENRGVISIDVFDPLFGYDFFLAFNNENVKALELEPYASYYSQLYRLSKKWRKFRRKRKLPMPFEN